MSRVAIVTDSTAYLPSDYIEKYKMRVVHLLVVCEDETFRDGVDILPEDLYNRLEFADAMSTTSQPSEADYKIALENLIAEGF